MRQALDVRFGRVPAPVGNWLGECADLIALRKSHQRALLANSVDELQTG